MRKTTAEIVEQLKNMAAAAMANSEIGKMIYCYSTVLVPVRNMESEFNNFADSSVANVYGSEDQEMVEVYYSELCAEWVQDCIDDGTLAQQVTEIEKGIEWVNNPENIEMLKKFA